MSKLFIVEDGDKRFTKVITAHLPDVFDGCGYTALTPVEGIKGDFVEAGKPCIGYSHILLIGTAPFIQKQPVVEGIHYGAYVLPQGPYVPAEAVEWMKVISKIATPCTMASAALNLAASGTATIPAVIPWGFPLQPTYVINRTEIRQLLVPEWNESLPVVLAPVQFAPVVLSAISRGISANVLLFGEKPENLSVMIDAYSLKPEQVRCTTSSLAWKAADLYLALGAGCEWPWDAVLALSHRLPILVPKTHVGETFTDELRIALGISAFDVGASLLAGYQSNSSDIADAIKAFIAEPQKMHVLANNGEKFFLQRTPERFTTELIKALFT